MQELQVTSAEANQRLNKYLMKYLDDAPSSFIYKMLRKKNITLNGKKASGDEIVSDGDIIRLYLSDETILKFKKNRYDSNVSKEINTGKELKVLYRDNDIIAVHKDAGILSQKAVSKDVSINEMIIDYCIKNNLIDTSLNISFKPSVCNRLDRNTSGIILAGISLHGSQMLSDILKKRDCEKIYYTIVKGSVKKSIHSVAYICKDEKENISGVISKQEYDKLDFAHKSNFTYIENVFEPLSDNGKYTLLKVFLITGKSHQIRANLRFLNYPVIGDSKYGDISVNRYFRDTYGLRHHLLHAGSVRLKNITITDALPDIFINICTKEHINTKNI